MVQHDTSFILFFVSFCGLFALGWRVGIEGEKIDAVTRDVLPDSLRNSPEL
jgi:hypothetical protein